MGGEGGVASREAQEIAVRNTGVGSAIRGQDAEPLPGRHIHQS